MSLIPACLLVLSWLTTEHFLPWVSWHAEVPAFLAVLIPCWIALVRRFKSGSAPVVAIPLAAWPFALLAGVVLAQVLTGTVSYLGDGVVLWFYMGLCGACLIAGFNAPRQVSPVRLGGAGWSPVAMMAATFLVGGTASAAIAFAQVFDLWEGSSWILRMPELRRPGADLGQPNQLATLLAMTVASVAYLCAEGKLSGRVSALILLLLGAGMAATESRTGALAVFILLVWWQAKRSRFAVQIPVWTGPAAAVGFLAMYLLWPRLLYAMHLLGDRADSRLGQGDVRVAVWTQLLEAAAQRPLWGWGFGGVAKAHNAVAHAFTTNNPFSYSHNIGIDLVVWLGWPVAVLLSGSATIWLWRRVRLANLPHTWYCLAILLLLAVHSMLEFPFAYAYFLAPTMFLVGYAEKEFGQVPRMRLGVKTALGVLLLFSAGLLWSAWEYLGIEEDFRAVRFEQLRIGSPTSHPPPSVVLLTQLGALLTASRIELRADMSSDEIDQLRQLALRYPWVATQYRYAVALALNGDAQEARRQFLVIRWQQNEKIYDRLRSDFRELGMTRHPQLRQFALP